MNFTYVLVEFTDVLKRFQNFIYKIFAEIGLGNASKRGKYPGSVIILTYTIYKNQVSALFIFPGKMPNFSQDSALFSGGYCIFCRAVVK